MHAVDMMKYGHLTILGAIDGLETDKWQVAGVCGVWSVKDIIAHLASFEQALVDILKSTLPGNTPADFERFINRDGKFNDEEVAKRSQKTVQQVLKEYESAHAEAMDVLSSIPSDQLRQTGALAWYGEAYDLEDFLVYTFYAHKREHSAQIAVYRDQL
jgi:uncharacterized damage-inducible protein DinB